MKPFSFISTVLIPAALLWALPLQAQHDHGDDDHGHAHDDHGHPHEEEAHDDHGPDDHGHPHQADAHDDHGHGASAHDDHDDHGHGGEESVVVVTHYTDTSELFMEHPALVQGEPARLIVHLTRLSDFTPITRGSLEVRLVPAHGQAYTLTDPKPARTGIFLPTITPPSAGTVTMELVLRSDQMDTVHRLEGVPVYASAHDVPAAEEEAESANAISFLKEQQWRIDFATTPAEEREVSQAVRAFGTLQIPAPGTAIVPAPADGIVRFVAGSDTLLEVGANMPKGAALFAIEPDASWGAGLAGLREDYLLAQLEVDRLESLLREEAVAASRVEAARIRLRTLESAIERLGAEGKPGRESEFRAKAVAPFAGLVTEIRVRPGQRVQAGDPLAVMIDPSRLVLEVSVPTARLYGVPSVKDARFVVIGGEDSFRVAELGGRLVSATPTSAAGEGLSQIRFVFDNPDGQLIAGSRATVHLIAGNGHDVGVAIPVGALHEEQGTPLVYVHTEGETVEKRYPRLGASDGQFVRVLSGIEAGERVVTKGATAIRLSSLSTSEMGHGHAH
jgi:RND family efflux transporter MFP subunit